MKHSFLAVCFVAIVAGCSATAVSNIQAQAAQLCASANATISALETNRAQLSPKGQADLDKYAPYVKVACAVGVDPQNAVTTLETVAIPQMVVIALEKAQ